MRNTSSINLSAIIVLILLAIALLLSGCFYASPATEEFGVETTVKELSSPKLLGRLTGTDGNLKAQSLIENHFKSLGLKPLFSDSYLQSYSHTMFQPDKQEFTLNFHLEDGSVRRLTYGKDFMEQRVNERFHTVSPLSFDLQDSHIEQKIAIIEDSAKLSQAYEHKPLAILKRSDTFMKLLPEPSDGVPVLQISPDTADWLNHHRKEVRNVEIGMKLHAEEITASNVVGYLPGTQSEEHRHAIVLSAHFDHVGWVGTGKDKTIYQGSLDNASGVSALLQLASILSTVSAAEFESDLIFAAFNGEESGMQGSKAFVKQLSYKYDHVYNINIDCLGLKNGNRMLLVGNPSSPLLSALNTYMTKRGISSTTEGTYGGSDHLSFLESGFEAVTITQENIQGFHTTDDTPDHLDFKLLDQYVEVLSNFILEQGDSPEFVHGDQTVQSQISPLMSEQQATMSELLEQAEKERESLRLGEYKLIGPDEQPLLVIGSNETFTDKSSAEQAVVGLMLPAKIGEYAFGSAIVNLTFPNTETNDFNGTELNKVYKYKSEITTEDIEGLGLIYKDDHGRGVSISISRTKFDFEGQNISESKKIYNGHEYTVIYTPEYVILSTEANVRGQQYFLQIYGGKDHQVGGEGTSFVFNWTSEDLPLALKWTDGIDWGALIEGMGI